MSKSRALVCCLALVAVTAAITSRVASQDSARAEELWQKYSVPGKQHDVLNRLAGKWDEEVKIWESPGAEPAVFRQTVDYRWIYGGRFLVGNYAGYVLGDPFNAREVLGYDRFRGEYNSFWIDNMTTGFVLAKGRFDSGRNELVFEGREDDVERDRRDIAFKLVYRFGGEDEMVIEYSREGSRGRMVKNAEVRATRAD